MSVGISSGNFARISSMELYFAIERAEGFVKVVLEAGAKA
jgi:hypothetical protein